MKILLTTLNAKYIHSSLALRYLKAYSIRDFNNIEIIEYTINEPIDTILSDIYQKQPAVIGLSCYIWNVEETMELVKLIKKIMPKAIIILGGPEVSFDIAYWLKRVEEIDFIIYGEGELTFNRLLKVIKEQKDFKQIQGIAFKDKSEIKINPPQIRLNLDDLPNPYNDQNDLFNLKDKIVYFEASRGCPFSCTYCLSSTDNNVRFFSLERVKNDLLNLIDNGVKTIKFVDRTFNANKKFALEIFKFLTKNHHGTIFQFEITVDIMDDEMIDYLVNNAPKGIFRFEVGVQSTNENTNNLINRKQNFIKLNENVLRLKKNNNITLHMDLIAGLPEENYDSFRGSFNDVFRLKPEELQLGFLKILRGTSIAIEAKKYDYLYMDKAPYEVLQNRALPYEEIIRIKRVELILEKYWNSHRFDFTLDYLLEYEFETAFDFFQEFGDFWELRGWNRIGHQLESLFIRMQEFLEDKEVKNLDFIISLMKLDYLLNHKYKPRKTWWDFGLTKQEQGKFVSELVERPELVTGEFQKLNLSEKNIHKHIIIDALEYDLDRYLTKGELLEGKTLLIVYYNYQEKPEYFFKKI